MLLLLGVSQQLGLLVTLSLDGGSVSLGLRLQGSQPGLLSLKILELFSGAIGDVLDGCQLGQELAGVTTGHELGGRRDAATALVVAQSNTTEGLAHGRHLGRLCAEVLLRTIEILLSLVESSLGLGVVLLHLGGLLVELSQAGLRLIDGVRSSLSSQLNRCHRAEDDCSRHRSYCDAPSTSRGATTHLRSSKSALHCLPFTIT